MTPSVHGDAVVAALVDGRGDPTSEVVSTTVALTVSA